MSLNFENFQTQWTEYSEQFKENSAFVLNYSQAIYFYFWNFFDLLCHLFKNAAKMRTNSDEISKKSFSYFSITVYIAILPKIFMNNSCLFAVWAFFEFYAIFLLYCEKLLFFFGVFYTKWTVT